jgi:hypothetical protein
LRLPPCRKTASDHRLGKRHSTKIEGVAGKPRILGPPVVIANITIK